MNCNSLQAFSHQPLSRPSEPQLAPYAFSFPFPSPSSTLLSHPQFHPFPHSQMERGKWSSREQRLYIQFLQENSLEIETKLSRKANKIFKKMSQVIKTRTADQCRSHHQKIINYHETVDRIIRYYSNLFQKDSSRDIGMKMIPTTSNEEGQIPPYTISRNKNTFRIQIRQSAIAVYQN